jgi:hypothetical protein
MVSSIVVRASSTIVVASRARVTSAYDVGMPVVPRDRCYRSKGGRE